MPGGGAARGRVRTKAGRESEGEQVKGERAKGGERRARAKAPKGREPPQRRQTRHVANVDGHALGDACTRRRRACSYVCSYVCSFARARRAGAARTRTLAPVAPVHAHVLHQVRSCDHPVRAPAPPPGLLLLRLFALPSCPCIPCLLSFYAAHHPVALCLFNTYTKSANGGCGWPRKVARVVHHAAATEAAGAATVKNASTHPSKASRAPARTGPVGLRWSSIMPAWTPPGCTVSWHMPSPASRLYASANAAATHDAARTMQPTGQCHTIHAVLKQARGGSYR